jgi:trehalose 6-phosphate phosphatase
VKHVLAREGLAALATLARAPCLVALDFDGTLAPIVDDRDAAAMRPATRALLDTVAHRYPAAVISGRAHDDLAARLGAIPLVARVGNHGLDVAAADGTFRERTAAWRACLASWLEGEPGVEIEDKGLSLAVHYRSAPDPRLASAAIHTAIARLAGARLVGGKRVANVLPEGGPNKGDALRALAARAGTRVALYVGDDDTDEDAFRLARGVEVFGVRVARSTRSAARWFLDAQEEIDVLLGHLADLRA